MTETWPVRLDKSKARREEILAAATRLFNRKSFAGVTLDAVAAEVGVTSGALYHHFANKELLVFECLSRGIALYREELARAMEQGIDGLELVRRFIRGRLRPGEPRMIVFSDLNSLPKIHREAVHRGRMENVERLAGLIASGVADGTVAARDPYLSSLAVFAVLDWMPLWYSENSYYTRQEAADAIDDLLTHGVLSRHVPEPLSLCDPWDLDEAISRLVPHASRALRRERILRAASQSFNQYGVVGSSMEAIANDAGLTRGAVYHHAPDKMTLLRLCLERAYRREGELLDLVLRKVGTEADPVRRIIAEEVYIMRAMVALHESDIGPKINFQNVAFLSQEQRRQMSGLHEEVVGANRERYVRGIDSGLFRKLDINFMQEIGAGLRNNFPTLFTMSQGQHVMDIADLCARLFLFGLKPRNI
ncbi:TetR/AcrR family transcriptional regulator [Sphingobium chlorophenolicum]|uniref:Putative transcriptional regulator (TetR family) protein n=1 Tax=Sphingobium chlorophenolicum TaxID=46429 RepID=A0A081RFC4_SPHCR|nr:TetR/AcrR family transcriptional regulator [Sphingobium chlorophenolicum]KEQ53897.1 putative transcriptional regulator (TetR family) protein [Sphingobium chlorophenolicum]